MQSTKYGCATLMGMVVMVICVALLPAASRAQCLSDDDTIKSTADKLYLGQRNFSVSLLDALQAATPSESLFFSPHSTYHALLMAYFGAQGETEAALKKTLQLDWATNKAEVSKAYHLEHTARKIRAENQSVEFHSVDKIYVAKEVEIRKCMTKLFSENVESLDFQKEPEVSRDTINKFVSDVTKGNINDLLVPGAISEETKLVLANAAYFKGQWSSKFDAEETKPRIFYDFGRIPVYVDMMKQRGYFNYGVIEKLNTVTLELPYLGEDSGISMFIFLPVFTPTAIDEMLKGLTPELLDEALEGGVQREVDVELPRISFEKTYEFLPVLKRMGVGNLFDADANLKGFSETTDLKLGDAVHKAKIEINEEGSTAAAATVLFSFRSSRPLEPSEFHCNHPFMFLIHDQKSKEILFAGVYRGPSK